MSTLKVVANNIALDFVKETLTLKRDNNAMIRDFRVNYSSNPFLVIENKKTELALGPRDIKSVNKKTIVPVVVYEADIAYAGELQVLTCIRGYRKCNLKYGTELISIMSKKISEFMPKVSVIPGVTNPDPYVEENEGTIAGYTHWETYPVSFIDDVFPNVMWQFPTLYWQNRFGVDLPEDDPWFLYENLANKFNDTLTAVIKNEFAYDGSGNLLVYNRNVLSPQVFLLAPLFYALNSLGWKPAGDFYTDAFINRLLILTAKHNMTKVKLFASDSPIDFTSVSWVLVSVGTPFEGYLKTKLFSITETGTYTFTFSLTLNGPFTNTSNNYFFIAAPGDTGFTPVVSINYQAESSKVYSGTFEMVASSVGDFTFLLKVKDLAQFGAFSLTIRKNEEKYFYQPNPTIELGRFVPEWTFGTYLNELKNFFNLDIEIDDFTKTLSLNFFDEVITNEIPEKLRTTLLNESFDLPQTQAFRLKYQNDEDESAWITADGAVVYTNQTSDFLETLDSKFKFVPNNLITAKLSEALFDKEGVGLMIYNELNRPNISTEYAGQNLKILGSGGIYESFWRSTLKFRINASVIEVEGVFSKSELASILKSNILYLNQQEFIVETVTYSETKDNNFNIKFKIHSKTL